MWIFALLACSPSPAPSPVAWVHTSARCEALAPEPPVERFYDPVRTYDDPVEHAFITGTPRSQGMDPVAVDGVLEALGEERFVTSFLLLRRGVLVAERYFHGVEQQTSQSVHSASKSMMAEVVGALVADGILDLDQPVASYLPELFAAVDDPDKRAITGRHLLTMTAGFQWREDRTEAKIERSADWLAAILAQPQDTPPGASFNYSTAQTHLLGAALAAASGHSLCDEVHARLFDPLGISAERWGRDPQGWFSGGFNVSLTPRELARFGQMVLDRGRFEGRQLLPADWVDASVTPQVPVGGGYRYGYLFWLRRSPLLKADIAWGYGGQQVFILPEQELVVVFTTDTSGRDPDFDGGEWVAELVAGISAER